MKAVVGLELRSRHHLGRVQAAMCWFRQLTERPAECAGARLAHQGIVHADSAWARPRRATSDRSSGYVASRIRDGPRAHEACCGLAVPRQLTRLVLLRFAPPR